MDFKLQLSKGFKIYLSILIISLILFIFLYSNSPFWFRLTDSESALYLLSSLVQSEAAVLGIVVTLSIVAIQLTSSSYSTRVIGIFRESASLWILILMYLIAIVYGLWVLKFLSSINGFSSNEFQIWIVYLLGIYAFSALLPYILDILNFMDPRTVINLLAAKITKKNIMLSMAEEDYNVNYRPSSGPIQPLSDIMFSALMKYDYGTLKDGLKALENSMLKILENEDITEEENDISNYLFIHNIMRLGEMALAKDDESSAALIIESLCKLGIFGINQNYSRFSESAAYIMQEIGIKAALNNNEYILNYSMVFLNVLGQNATFIKGFESVVKWELDSELRVILTAITNQPEPKVRYDISIYTNDIEYDPELNLLLKIINSNNIIGSIAVDQKNDIILKNVIKNLKEIQKINRKLHEKKGYEDIKQKLDELILNFSSKLQKE